MCGASCVVLRPVLGIVTASVVVRRGTVSCSRRTNDAPKFDVNAFCSQSNARHEGTSVKYKSTETDGNTMQKLAAML
jgi:hypothetical protein